MMTFVVRAKVLLLICYAVTLHGSPEDIAQSLPSFVKSSFVSAAQEFSALKKQKVSVATQLYKPYAQAVVTIAQEARKNAQERDNLIFGMVNALKLSFWWPEYWISSEKKTPDVRYNQLFAAPLTNNGTDKLVGEVFGHASLTQNGIANAIMHIITINLLTVRANPILQGSIINSLGFFLKTIFDTQQNILARFKAAKNGTLDTLLELIDALLTELSSYPPVIRGIIVNICFDELQSNPLLEAASTPSEKLSTTFTESILQHLRAAAPTAQGYSAAIQNIIIGFDNNDSPFMRYTALNLMRDFLLTSTLVSPAPIAQAGALEKVPGKCSWYEIDCWLSQDTGWNKFTNFFNQEIPNGFKTGVEKIQLAQEMAMDVLESQLVNSIEIAHYCPTLPSQPTIQDPTVRELDTENLIPLIEKYAPVFYLHENELYMPTSLEEFYMGTTASIMLDDGKELKTLIPQGKVTTKKLMGLSKQYPNSHAYVEIGTAKGAPKPECGIKFGSNPSNNQDAYGNLTTPAYVITSESPDGKKIFIQYINFFAFNGPYSISLPLVGNILTGDKQDIQNAHEGDLEHMTLEFDKETRKLERIYYGSHGRDEGVWLPADHRDIKYEDWHNRDKQGTHPVVYVARYGHGNYPKTGVYVRIGGLANDETGAGKRWTPRLVRVYKQNDKRYKPEVQIPVFWPAYVGRRGVDALGRQAWFGNAQNDEGRPDGYASFEETHCSTNSASCIDSKRLKAKIPD